MNMVLLAQETPQEVFYKAFTNGLTENRAMQVIGALQIVDKQGLRILKTMLKPQSYYRLKKDIEKLQANDNYLYEVFKDVKLDIQKMEGVKDDKILQM